MLRHLLPLIPPHRIYVEVFGGAAHLLFAKQPSEIEVYNDIDSALVNFFRVLRDPVKSEELCRLLTLTPYSREEHSMCCLTYENTDLSDVERARRFYVAVHQSFNGIVSETWRTSRTEHTSRVFAGAVDRLPVVCERIRGVLIEHDDFRVILKRYDTPDTFFYCDPPYLPDTRCDKNVYVHEMSTQDHIDLLEMLHDIQGKVMVSGYDSELYTKYLDGNGWTRHEFDVVLWANTVITNGHTSDCVFSSRRGRRKEVVWLNPHCVSGQLGLFDGNI